MVTWTFVPDEGVSLYTDDTTYLTFGWWLDKDAGGNPEDFWPSHSYGAGRNGGQRGGPAAAGVESEGRATVHGATIRGSATYKGAAAGKYATASTADSYEGGHFTAMATLMVDFDADPDLPTLRPDRNGVALSGMIDNFMTGDTAAPIGW